MNGRPHVLNHLSVPAACFTHPEVSAHPSVAAPVCACGWPCPQAWGQATLCPRVPRQPALHTPGELGLHASAVQPTLHSTCPRGFLRVECVGLHHRVLMGDCQALYGLPSGQVRACQKLMKPESMLACKKHCMGLPLLPWPLPATLASTGWGVGRRVGRAPNQMLCVDQRCAEQSMCTPPDISRAGRGGALHGAWRSVPAPLYISCAGRRVARVCALIHTTWCMCCAQISFVGLTQEAAEEQAKEKGFALGVSKTSFKANSKVRKAF